MAEYINKESAISIFTAKAEMAVCTPAQPYFANAAKMIEILPAADVAPVVHGRWVEWYPPKNMILTGEEMLYRCSSCDAKYSDVEGFRFCPNCGARMDLEV